ASARPRTSLDPRLLVRPEPPGSLPPSVPAGKKQISKSRLPRKSTSALAPYRFRAATVRGSSQAVRPSSRSRARASLGSQRERVEGVDVGAVGGQDTATRVKHRLRELVGWNAWKH